eukprot:scaffold27457_cov164-Isochrysis_galbana.AAC.2
MYGKTPPPVAPPPFSHRETYTPTLNTSSTAPSPLEKEDSLPNTAPSAACAGSEERTPYTWGNAT